MVKSKAFVSPAVQDWGFKSRQLPETFSGRSTIRPGISIRATAVVVTQRKVVE